MLDMATSSTAYFALVEAQRAGRPVGNDIGYDAAGNPTTDAGAILNGGAMRSFDRWVSKWRDGEPAGSLEVRRCSSGPRWCNTATRHKVCVWGCGTHHSCAYLCAGATKAVTWR